MCRLMPPWRQRRLEVPHFGRILAAYGGVFVAGSLAWGVVVDGFRPDRWELLGTAVGLAGVALIMYAPRSDDHSSDEL